MLSIQKRHDCCYEQYSNVCLIFNENDNDEMCTNTPDGFNNDASPFITWYKPTSNVYSVELHFRDQKYAHIADLKIFYEPDMAE